MALTATTPGLPTTVQSAGAPSTLLTPTRSRTRAPVTPNVANVVLDNVHIVPWYPSFYPEELVGGRRVGWLYVCASCFRYTGDAGQYRAHCKVCPLRNTPAPGDVVYAKGEHIIHEIDGEEHKTYAQNLSLLSKLFLDTKSVFFDVATFLYYPLLLRSPAHPHGQVVGFFSKEKMSWDNNNVACILVFPPWQKRGLGQILIAASYELGKREGRFGGPERPLSGMGRKGYVGFWCGAIFRYLLATPAGSVVTVRGISEGTYILQEDVVVALREIEGLQRRVQGGADVVVDKTKLREWARRVGVSAEPVIDVEAFVGGAQEEEEEEDEEEEDEEDEDDEEDGEEEDDDEGEEREMEVQDSEGEADEMEE